MYPGLVAKEHPVTAQAQVLVVGAGFSGSVVAERLASQGYPVLVIDKDVFAPVTTGGDVVDGAGEFDAQWAGHVRRLRGEEAKGKA